MNKDFILHLTTPHRPNEILDTVVNSTSGKSLSCMVQYVVELVRERTLPLLNRDSNTQRRY